MLSSNNLEIIKKKNKDNPNYLYWTTPEWVAMQDETPYTTPAVPRSVLS